MPRACTRMTADWTSARITSSVSTSWTVARKASVGSREYSSGWDWITIATKHCTLHARIGRIEIIFQGESPNYRKFTHGYDSDFYMRWQWPELDLPRGVLMPIWLLFVVVAVPTAFCWWRDRPYVPPGHCRQCGYDLTGNVSGRCPECGEAT